MKFIFKRKIKVHVQVQVINPFLIRILLITINRMRKIKNAIKLKNPLELALALKLSLCFSQQTSLF